MQTKGIPMLLRLLVFAHVLVIWGCMQQIEDPHQLDRIRAIMERDGAQIMEQKRAQVRESQLPSNYQQLIDARFVDILKDPDSRRVEYLDNPYGSLVCGTINARNSYGGYTGKHPFLAYFDASGKLRQLASYSDQDMKAFIRSNLQNTLSLTDIEQVLREKKLFILRCMLGDIKKLQGRIVKWNKCALSVSITWACLLL
jgi:hypothetical protein